MATIRAAADGTLLQVLDSPDLEARYPDAPAGTTQTVQLDEDTNAAVLAGLRTDWNAHRVVGGVLQRDGQPVALAANGAGALGRAQLIQLRSEIEQYTARLAEIRTQMDQVEAATISTLAQGSTAIKTTAAAVDDLALGMTRLARAVWWLARHTGA
jgi:hypothetical protein